MALEQGPVETQGGERRRDRRPSPRPKRWSGIERALREEFGPLLAGSR